VKERRKGDGVAGPGVKGAVALAISSHSCMTAVQEEEGSSMRELRTVLLVTVTRSRTV
jgi:hypothetical protein